MVSGALERLGRLGARYRDPLAELDFAAADPVRPWLPEELLSVAGLPVYEDLTPETRRRLSQVEFGRLCAAGLWLEGLLIGRAAAGGYVRKPAREARVVLQEVREEAGHGLMFVEMMDRARLDGVELLGPTRLLTWIAHRLHSDDAEFWAMVYIGESVTNSYIARALRPEPSSRICPLARQVMALHHRDEARHIAAARSLLEARVATMGALRRRIFAATFRFLLRRFLRATLYPTPASLLAAGIPDPQRVARAARACPLRRSLARACALPAVQFIARSGLVPPMPA
jgi:hypothetical protein